MTTSIYGVSTTEKCPICWEESSADNPMVAHSGSGHLHPIHLKCLQAWVMVQDAFCPSCKVKMDISTLYKFSKIDRLYIAFFQKTLENSLLHIAIEIAFVYSTIFLGFYSMGYILQDVRSIYVNDYFQQVLNRLVSVIGLSIFNIYLLKPKNTLPLQNAFEKKFPQIGIWPFLGVEITNLLTLGCRALKTDALLKIALVAAIALCVYKKVNT